MLALAACTAEGAAPPELHADLARCIPDSADWVRQAPVLAAGTPGDWDARLPAGTPGSLLEKGDSLYLYYVGAEGDRADGGPAGRKVGLASSSADGRTWTKHSANPLLSFGPNGDNEEGAWRLAGVVDSAGTIHLFVSMLRGSGGSVNGDVRLYTSTNGVDFEDRGIVLDHSNAEVWGHGDELGVLGVTRAPDGTWHLFYTAKAGRTAEWDVGHAWGDTPLRIGDHTEKVPGVSPPVRYGSDPAWLSDSIAVVPLGSGTEGSIDIRAARVAALGKVSTPALRWSGLTAGNFAVTWSEKSATWLLVGGTGQDPDDLDGLELFTARPCPIAPPGL